MIKTKRDSNEYYTVKEAANRLKMSVSAIQNHIKKGDLQNAIILTGRLGYRIPISDILQLEQKIKKDRKKYEDYLSVQEMANKINCSEVKIRNDIKNKKIKHYILHNRIYKVHKNDFQNYIQEYIERVQDCLNLQETADRLNISKATVGKYLRNDIFPNAFIRKQSEGYFIPISDIINYESTVEIPEGYMVVKDIAQYLSCHQETVRELIRNGQFKNVKKHSRNSYIVSIEELEKYYKEKIYAIKDYMNITQAAIFLSCHKDTIRSYLKKGLFTNYLYRNKIEGYLISKNDLVKMIEPLNIPEGFITLKDAAKKLNMKVGQVSKLAEDKFKNSYQAKEKNGKKTWIVSEKDIMMYIKRKKQRLESEKDIEYSTLDAVKKFKNKTENLIHQFPNKKEIHKLFSNYAINKLSNSNAREETLKKKVSYYIKTLKIVLEKIDKDVSDLTDDDINCFLNDSTVIEYVKQYFIGFIQYCSENAEDIRFKNDYRTTRRSASETEVYSMDIFKSYFEYASDVDLHTNQAIKLKTYAQSWLYVIMHLMNAWRSGDIVYGLPKIEFNDLNFRDLEYFKDNKLTREQAQLIINQVHIKVGKIKLSKTGSLGQFLCIDSLAISFATAISIVELHRRKKNEKLMLNSIRSNGINKRFFEKKKELENFDSLKMNRTLITYFFHHVSKSGGDAHLSYEAAQILRSHESEDTTSVYIKFSNAGESFDEISFNICERGHFGWIYNCMINLFFDQKNQTLQERTEAIQAFQEKYTVPTIETYASFLLTERNQNNSLALRLAEMSKEELKYLITKIFRGEMPAKTEHAQCLVYPECSYPTRKTCLGCENIIPTDYVLISVTEQIKTTMLNLYNSKTSRIREREFYYLKKLFILINQAIVEKGREYVDTFIDREQLKKLFIALTENNKGEETVIDKPKNN
ncbi:helix-turn-helix domain-containing protein [Staphylococcus arlettae]|uniref:helix-turn-helix domain-containing protein n=1 Tax=Staphylococcus arlettae TaxID=29378 RepID=UPI003516DC78